MIFLFGAAFFAAFYFILSNIDLKNNYITRELNLIIAEFGLKKYIPFINGLNLFCFLSTVLFIVLAKMVISGFVLGVPILAAGLLAVFHTLKSMNKHRTGKLGKSFLNFLNLYTNFFNTYNNCPDALREAGKYAKGVIGSVVTDAMAKYDRSSASFDDALDYISSVITNAEFNKFISFTRMFNQYGGDYNDILYKLREQAIRNMEINSEKESNSRIAIIVIGSMILLSLMSLIAIKPSDVYVLTHTFVGWLIIAFNISAYMFAVYMVKNIAN